MVRRKLCTFALLATSLGWSGCNSSAEQSYEIVETPHPASGTSDVATTTHETANPDVGGQPPAQPGVTPGAVTEAASQSAPSVSGPDARTAAVEKALAQGPSPTPAIQIAAMAARDGVQTPAPPILQVPGAEGIQNLTPNKIELKIPHKEFSREGRERALRVTFDDLDLLKILNMEPVPLNAEEYLPDWLKGLNGEKVRLRGWMFPPLMTEELPAFLFVRDNQICCFGREAKVYDKLRVTLKEGTTTDYIFGRPFDVIGTFRIESEEQDGELYFLYSIDDAVVMK